ncbi:MAG: tetratricopeptide repeat-containing glycosyltransferase family protein [Verrucomicrobiae bacterium]|nr:tetratricopeptide repeat-containing glycosyltransferase family protein [Verrucomicrobiae bacterium]
MKLAFAAHHEGRHAEAEALCRLLLPGNPADAQLLYLLGMILHKAGRDAEAADHLQRAAALQPAAAHIFSGVGCAQRGLGDWAGARQSFARATELEPRNGDHFYHLGLAEHALGQLERALAAFQKAVELNPRDFMSWNNLGKIFQQFNRLDESLAAYDHALKISPDYELAKTGRAILLLTAGRLGEGFREFESPWKQNRPRIFARPRWRGESVAGQTVFIHAERGFGDGIHFARFVPAVRERAARVILECRPELKSLFVLSDCAGEVVAFGEPVPAFDVFTSLMSLPGLLGITENSIPGRVPYLRAPPASNLPPAKNGNLKVGFAWAGSAAHPDDASRSMPLELFAPILQTPGVTFYSLQLPVPERDKPFFQSLPALVDLSPALNDYLATATFMAQLDLVIAVDTSVVHLAGALAMPVWTLTQFDADWRWFLDRSDTPWYPTMRLFRQTQRGQWPPVVARVAEALRRRATG